MSKHYKLLYAEDEIETRKNITLYINDNYKLDIIEADDGKKAWESYLKYKPDILITDLLMPNICGLELIEKIREVDKDIKIIVISAHSSQDKLLQAIKLNLIEYQIKPINRKKLLNGLDMAINSLENGNTNNKFYFNSDSYFDILENSLVVHTNTIKLTKNEIKLLRLFIDNNNKTLDSLDIFNNIWEFSKEYKTESIRTLVKKLRKKLPLDTIENIYGGGYKLLV